MASCSPGCPAPWLAWAETGQVHWEIWNIVLPSGFWLEIKQTLSLLYIEPDASVCAGFDFQYLKTKNRMGAEHRPEALVAL